jgi:hypothetical protein
MTRAELRKWSKEAWEKAQQEAWEEKPRPLTQEQIKSMIRLLQEAQTSGWLGFNVNVPILAAANFWKSKPHQKDMEEAEYLCEWLESLIGNVLGLIRLDHWLKEHHGINADEDIDKWKATQVAMYKWMEDELTKEMKCIN